jgi:hypothetical protein
MRAVLCYVVLFYNTALLYFIVLIMASTIRYLERVHQTNELAQRNIAHRVLLSPCCKKGLTPHVPFCEAVALVEGCLEEVAGMMAKEKKEYTHTTKMSWSRLMLVPIICQWIGLWELLRIEY